MQYRRNKLAEQLRLEISSILARELRDRIKGLVTITVVELTPDLRYARVLVSLFGSPADKEETLGVLTGSVGQIRRLIGGRIRLRHTPEFSFVVDNSIEHGDRMVEMIEKLTREEREEQA